MTVGGGKSLVGEGVEKLSPDLFIEMYEKYGDRPEWMKITAYKEARDSVSHRRRSELLLNLRGKDYWFPLSPKIYERFVSLIVNKSRGAGLRYLQDYIRRYRTYKEVWPSKRYVRSQRIRPKHLSFYPESAEDTDWNDLASRVGLDPKIIERICSMYSEGTSPSDIAKALGVSVPHVESVVSLVRGFSSGEITDSIISAVADGDIGVEEAVSAISNTSDLSDVQGSRKAWRALDRDKDSGSMKRIRVRGMKKRSPNVRIRSDLIR